MSILFTIATVSTCIMPLGESLSSKLGLQISILQPIGADACGIICMLSGSLWPAQNSKKLMFPTWLKYRWVTIDNFGRPKAILRPFKMPFDQHSRYDAHASLPSHEWKLRCSQIYLNRLTRFLTYANRLPFLGRLRAFPSESSWKSSCSSLKFASWGCLTIITWIVMSLGGLWQWARRFTRNKKCHVWYSFQSYTKYTFVIRWCNLFMQKITIVLSCCRLQSKDAPSGFSRLESSAIPRR